MRLRLTLFALIAAVAFPLAGFAQKPKVFDLTPAFVDCGVDIEELLVYRLGGIVLIRGTTSDATKAADAGRVATFLGYDRVANLIRVVDEPAADKSIEERGQRQLDLEPMLEGCRLRVDSNLGVVSVGGKVARTSQKALAIEVLLKVAGVKQVQWIDGESR
jgi:osmotically-inducible protein OsmY